MSWTIPQRPRRDLLYWAGRRWMLTLHGTEPSRKRSGRFWRQASAQAGADSLNRARRHFGMPPGWTVTDLNAG